MANTSTCPKNKSISSIIACDKVRGARMDDLEYNEDLQRLYREQQAWIADALIELYEQVSRPKPEVQHLYEEHPKPVLLQDRITQTLSMLDEQAAEENYPATRVSLEDKTEEMVKVSNRLYDDLVRALRLMRRQVLLFSAVLILLVTAYFFVPCKLTLPSKAAVPDSKSLETSGQASGIIAHSQVTPTQQSIKSIPIPEWEEITGILKQIRQAQLNKDINLFLNAYSPSFPNKDKKKETILKTWHQHDFLDMHFQVVNIQKLNANTIIARVAWDITIVDVRSKKKSTLLKDYTIHFSDVSGRWLIQELIRGTPQEPSQGLTKRLFHATVALHHGLTGVLL
jgi:hypothetical protein